MKILKLVSTGLIVFEDFDLPSISAPLVVNANLTQGQSYVEFLNGSIYFNASIYTDLVLEVDNSFVPTQSGDMGGVKLVRGSETRELYEYYDPQNGIGDLPHIKLLKNGNVYSGYGSNDGLNWNYRGDVYFSPVDTIHISAVGTSLYRLNSIKVYKSEYITIHSLLPGYKVKVYQSGILLDDVTVIDQSATLQLPQYPFSGDFKVYNNLNELVGDVSMVDVWGGDEYSLSVNVDIYDEDDVILTMQSARHMGHLDNRVLEKRFRIHNNNAYQINAVLSVADYSPFGNWVKLAIDINDLPDDYLDDISMTLGANEDKVFWIKITRPIDADTTYDYKQNECLWYLTIS